MTCEYSMWVWCIRWCTLHEVVHEYGASHNTAHDIPWVWGELVFFPSVSSQSYLISLLYMCDYSCWLILLMLLTVAYYEFNLCLCIIASFPPSRFSILFSLSLHPYLLCNHWKFWTLRLVPTSWPIRQQRQVYHYLIISVAAPTSP